MHKDLITDFLKSIGYERMEEDAHIVVFEKRIIPLAAEMFVSLIVNLKNGTFSFFTMRGQLEMTINDLSIADFLSPKRIEAFGEIEEVFKRALIKVVF